MWHDQEAEGGDRQWGQPIGASAATILPMVIMGSCGRAGSHMCLDYTRINMALCLDYMIPVTVAGGSHHDDDARRQSTVYDRSRGREQEMSDPLEASPRDYRTDGDSDVDMDEHWIELSSKAKGKERMWEEVAKEGFVARQGV